MRTALFVTALVINNWIIYHDIQWLVGQEWHPTVIFSLHFIPQRFSRELRVGHWSPIVYIIKNQEGHPTSECLFHYVQSVERCMECDTVVHHLEHAASRLVPDVLSNKYNNNYIFKTCKFLTTINTLQIYKQLFLRVNQ